MSQSAIAIDIQKLNTKIQSNKEEIKRIHDTGKMDKIEVIKSRIERKKRELKNYETKFFKCILLHDYTSKKIMCKTAKRHIVFYYTYSFFAFQFGTDGTCSLFFICVTMLPRTNESLECSFEIQNTRCEIRYSRFEIRYSISKLTKSRIRTCILATSNCSK